jgi:hypothetical protein
VSCLSRKVIAIIDGREGRSKSMAHFDGAPAKDWTGLWAIDQIQSHAALWMGTRKRMPDTGN